MSLMVDFFSIVSYGRKIIHLLLSKNILIICWTIFQQILLSFLMVTTCQVDNNTRVYVLQYTPPQLTPHSKQKLFFKDNLIICTTQLNVEMSLYTLLPVYVLFRYISITWECGLLSTLVIDALSLYS